MARVLIVFASRSGETEAIGNLIAEGVRIAGHQADVVNANSIDKAEALQQAEALIFGSATYHGEMLPSMKKLLFLAENAGLEGKTGGAFGAYGWSGEAPERIFETMSHIFKMDMVTGPLNLKTTKLAGAIQMAQQYGRDITAKLAG